MQAHIFQIFYSDESRSLLDPRFIPLDNTANEHPDWREYWPIRKFLLDAALCDDDYYGFLSPRFREKTGLSSEQVFEFVKPGHDVISFSPFPDLRSWYCNVFEQAELIHPGLTDLGQRFVNAVAFPAELRNIVMDSRQMIFANYFLAKPRFWTAWFQLAEKLFHIAESGTGPLAESLNAPVAYYVRGAAPAKVFIMERLASLLISTQGWTVSAYNPSLLPFSDLRLDNVAFELIVLDALKLAYNGTGYAHYVDAFRKLRELVASKLEYPTLRATVGARPM